MRVGIIGDLHCPYDYTTYLSFCLRTFDKLRINRVVAIGDLTDNHAISFHTRDPNLHSDTDELILTRRALRPWWRAFPDLEICTGNHDALPERQATDKGIAAERLRPANEVLQTPGWQWDWEYVIDDVLYSHGTGLSGDNAAINYAKENRMSAVIGHIHSNAGAKFHANKRSRIFGLSVGAGCDDKALAFAYGKFNAKRSILGCGVVLDGEQPIFIPMPIGKGERYNRRRAGKKRKAVLV